MPRFTSREMIKVYFEAVDYRKIAGLCQSQGLCMSEWARAVILRSLNGTGETGGRPE